MHDNRLPEVQKHLSEATEEDETGGWVETWEREEHELLHSLPLIEEDILSRRMIIRDSDDFMFQAKLELDDLEVEFEDTQMRSVEGEERLRRFELGMCQQLWSRHVQRRISRARTKWKVKSTRYKVYDRYEKERLDKELKELGYVEGDESESDSDRERGDIERVRQYAKDRYGKSRQTMEWNSQFWPRDQSIDVWEADEPKVPDSTVVPAQVDMYNAAYHRMRVVGQEQGIIAADNVRHKRRDRPERGGQLETRDMLDAAQQDSVPIPAPMPKWAQSMSYSRRLNKDRKHFKLQRVLHAERLTQSAGNVERSKVQPFVQKRYDSIVNGVKGVLDDFTFEMRHPKFALPPLD